MLNKLLNKTSLKANIVANFGGNAFAAIISLIFIPFYLKILGAESYGLIGVFASLQMVLSLLDTGLSTTLNRELATLNALPNKGLQMRNLVKTIGTVYWVLALLIGLIAMVVSPLLAKYWIHAGKLSIHTIQTAFFLLSISLIFQFPTGFYSGGLLGLQRHVSLNVLKIFFVLLKNGGALFILMLYSNSILIFFTWTLIVSVFQAFAYRISVWHYLPGKNNIPRFDKQELKNVWRFAAGMTGISITGILFSQIDKIILSKILPLDQFGYYTIASTIGLLIYQIIGPITQSYFPKFAELARLGDLKQLKYLYHLSNQLVSIIVLPVTLVLVFFSKELLWIWTQSTATVNNTWTIVSIFALGTGINGLINIPYQLTLAYGWTKLGLYQNLVLLILMIPLTILLALHFGAIGGAMSWLIVNVIYFCITPYMIHKRLLLHELLYWYWHDTTKPMLISVSTIFLFKAVIYDPLIDSNRWTSLLYFLVVLIITILISLLGTRDLRKKSKDILKRIWMQNPFIYKAS